MDSLSKRRGYLKGRLTIFKDYIVKLMNCFPDTTQALEEVKRLELLERINNI